MSRMTRVQRQDERLKPRKLDGRALRRVQKRMASKVPTRADVLRFQEMLNGNIRKRAIEQGLLSPSRKPLYFWNYTTDAGVTGTVMAYTRSEARAQVKSELGLPKGKRLPQSITLDKGTVAQAGNTNLPKVSLSARQPSELGAA